MGSSPISATTLKIVRVRVPFSAQGDNMKTFGRILQLAQEHLELGGMLDEKFYADNELSVKETTALQYALIQGLKIGRTMTSQETLSKIWV